MTPADWSPLAHASGSADGGARSVGRIEDYERLRSACPVAHADEFGGYVTLSRYEDVRAAARNHRTFKSGRPFAFLPDFTQSIPLGLNPPEHTIFRRALNKYFIPARIEELEPSVREHVVERVDGILAAGAGEVVSELCAPVTAQGLASLLNLSADGWRELVGHLAALDAIADDPERINATIFELFAATVARVVGERREHPLDPDRDLISGFMALEVDGEPISDELVIGIGVQILGAGHGTTRDGLSGALYLLATNPGDQARLRRKPDLIPAAIEEFLRVDPPAHEFAREATEDVELHDRTIRAGETVAFNYAAANRDESEFVHPSACIIDRAPNHHLSFGHGIHKCVGAPLARMEIRVALEEVLVHTRGFELDGPVAPNASYVSGGLSRLPLRFRAA